jgi:PTS system nitrogen regulatory IIA component
MESIDCFLNGSVVCDLKSRDKYSAIDELISRAKVFRKLPNIESFKQAVYKREKEQSTAFGHGVAIAHGKSTLVRSLFVALGISRDGIEFDAPDGKPVKFLFLIANPPHMQFEYLFAISTIARVARSKTFREALLSCSCTDEVEEKLSSAFKALPDKRVAV